MCPEEEESNASQPPKKPAQNPQRTPEPAKSREDEEAEDDRA